MVALVAALLVAAGGTARAAQPRVSAGTGQAGTAPQAGRHVATHPSSSYDLAALHLDLASTGPVDVPAPAGPAVEHIDGGAASFVSGDSIAAVVRGPPTA
nr:hypothetical protein [Aeromicrobium sp.]